MALRISDPKPGDWDYDGSCRPSSGGFFSNNTFSVGIFQWKSKANRVGVKRSSVVKRIKGYCNEPEDVYEKAEKYIKEHLENRN